MKETTKAKKTGVVVGVIAALAIAWGISGWVVYNQIYRQNSTTSSLKKTADAKDKTKVKGTSGTTTDTAAGDTANTETSDKYAGWQTYSNQTWAVKARYPSGWTFEETSGSLHVTFLGPPTPPGGVILNECAFRIFVEDFTGPGNLADYVAAARAEPQGGGTVVEDGPTTIWGNSAHKGVDTFYEVGHNWKRLRVWTLKNGKAYTFTFEASTAYNGTDYYALHLPTAELMLASVTIP